VVGKNYRLQDIQLSKSSFTVATCAALANQLAAREGSDQSVVLFTESRIAIATNGHAGWWRIPGSNR
jgi:TPP-dependent trihydroxycyclohexane-1,2-dione (THcHDO) dehydratase